MQTIEKKDLKAIHISDLKEILRDGNYENPLTGGITCQICNDVINLTNIGSMKYVDGRLLFSCNKVFCYEQSVRHQATI